uniref:Uncharacterized protein n=1 Tax=Anguilla anguilla TaxID=7936 RepID=A0A0E9WGS4_ANGAN
MKMVRERTSAQVETTSLQKQVRVSRRPQMPTQPSNGQHIPRLENCLHLDSTSVVVT